MKLYIARHGRTNYNELGLCNADPATDVHLTETGIAQAEGLAEKLKDANIEHVFVSELQRTLQTAQVVNKHHNAAVSVDKRLNDNRTGFEDMPVDTYLAALEKATDKWNARLNDGESYADVYVRVQSFVDGLKDHPYETVLVVTSMSIVRAFVGILKNLSPEEIFAFEVENADCVEFDI